jgi:hypothetical protein
MTEFCTTSSSISSSSSSPKLTVHSSKSIHKEELSNNKGGGGVSEQETQAKIIKKKKKFGLSYKKHSGPMPSNNKKESVSYYDDNINDSNDYDNKHTVTRPSQTSSHQHNNKPSSWSRLKSRLVTFVSCFFDSIVIKLLLNPLKRLLNMKRKIFLIKMPFALNWKLSSSSSYNSINRSYI